MGEFMGKGSFELPTSKMSGLPNTQYPPTPGPSGQHGLPTLRNGSQGMSVAYLQNLLNARLPMGNVLWVDGMFGPKTDAKVRQFQSMRKLIVDGIVGIQTWAALEAGPPPISKRPC